MDLETITVYLCTAAFFAMVFGMFLLMYEDGIPMSRWRKLRCKLGWHKVKENKSRKYYCQYCKKPRRHPPLKMLDGGNKIGNNWFRE